MKRVNKLSPMNAAATLSLLSGLFLFNYSFPVPLMTAINEEAK